MNENNETKELLAMNDGETNQEVVETPEPTPQLSLERKKFFVIKYDDSGSTKSVTTVTTVNEASATPQVSQLNTPARARRPSPYSPILKWKIFKPEANDKKAARMNDDETNVASRSSSASIESMSNSRRKKSIDVDELAREEEKDQVDDNMKCFSDRRIHEQEERELEGQDTITSLSNNIYLRQLDKIRKKSNVSADSLTGSNSMLSQMTNSRGSCEETSFANSLASVNASSRNNLSSPSLAKKPTGRRSSLKSITSAISHTISGRSSLSNALPASNVTLNLPKTSFLLSQSGSFMPHLDEEHEEKRERQEAQENLIKLVYALNANANVETQTVLDSLAVPLVTARSESSASETTKRSSSTVLPGAKLSTSRNSNTLSNVRASQVVTAAVAGSSSETEMIDDLKRAISRNPTLIDRQLIEDVIFTLRQAELKQIRKRNKTRCICLLAQLLVFMFMIIMTVALTETVVIKLKQIMLISAMRQQHFIINNMNNDTNSTYIN